MLGVQIVRQRGFGHCHSLPGLSVCVIQVLREFFTLRVDIALELSQVKFAVSFSAQFRKLMPIQNPGRPKALDRQLPRNVLEFFLGISGSGPSFGNARLSQACFLRLGRVKPKFQVINILPWLLYFAYVAITDSTDAS